MNSSQQVSNSLQASLRSLSLGPSEEGGRINSECLLIGKILATRVFRRFTLSEIIAKIWRLQTFVKVEKIDENIFKFFFGSKGDRDSVFRNRPWSLDGAHLILKQWPEDRALHEISFDTSTFWLQIHGLPPAIIHEGTAEKIGNTVGSIHPETINRRCIVAHRYLRIRVDIAIEKPLPPGFFYDRANDDELWVQFKYEKLPDFCYKCGNLKHVTGRCNFGTPATLTSANGIKAKVYGPWMRAEFNGSLSFVNSPEEEENRRSNHHLGKSMDLILGDQSHRLLLSDKTTEEQQVNSKTNPTEEIQAAREMCTELDALYLTLQGQFSGSIQEAGAALLNQVRLSNNDPQLLAKWATESLKKICIANTHTREDLSEMDPHWLGELGLGPAYFTRPHGPVHKAPDPKKSTDKRALISALPKPNKRQAQELSNIPESNEFIVSPDLSPNIPSSPQAREKDQSPSLSDRVFRLGRSESAHESSNSGGRKWKKDARHGSARNGSHSSRRISDFRGAQSSGSNRDFPQAEEAGRFMPPLRDEDPLLEL